MNIKELRMNFKESQTEFSNRYNIPFRTIQNWENGKRKPPAYLLDLLNEAAESDLINHKTTALPQYDPKKKNLPKRSNYIGSISWLKAIKECLGDNFVFALDEALMCQGLFGGRNDEYIVYVYGDDSLSEYNGVVIIGNHISDFYTKKKDGLLFTNLNRTIEDSFANESLLDFQGITEAISKYICINNGKLENIYVSPKYQRQLENLIKESSDYYSY